MSRPFLEARGLGRAYPGVRALDDVSLIVERGCCLAVVGENGAGKSTLMKLLAGLEAPDSGSILVEGVPVSFASVRDARARGIALIPQERMLCANLTVGAELLLGREPLRHGFIDRGALRRRARGALDRLRLDLDVRARVGDLTPGQQQLLEVAKALDQDASLLILDEPTSSLGAAESERLHDALADLRGRGTAIVYISHRLPEILRLADRAVVLRDGRVVAGLERERIDAPTLVAWMAGTRAVQPAAPESQGARGRAASPGDAPRLEADGLRSRRYPRHAVSFRVGAGEIVGLAGLVGAGRTELLRALFGVDRPAGGSLRVDGSEYAPRHPEDALARGVALVPEERQSQGLVLGFDVRKNLGLARAGRDARRGFLDRRRERAMARELIGRLAIRTPDDRASTRSLSGGNQQKVVIGKGLSIEPRVLLLDEPTRGVDVGAKAEIHARVRELAAAGTAVLVASSEIDELLALCDRLLVLRDGCLTGELARGDVSEAEVLALATAGTPGGRA